jgi:competence protein ComEC
VTAAADARRTWLDLRLVPVAVAVWAVTLGAAHVPPAGAAAVAAGAVLGGGLVARRRDRAGALVALAVLAAVATAASVAAVRGAARAASPLAQLGGDRSVTVVLEVDGDPRRVGGAAAPRLVLDATVAEVDDGRRTVHLGAAVVVFAPEEGWEGLLPGQRVRARVAVAPVPASAGVVARLSARGPPQRLGGPPRVQVLAGGLRDGLAGSAARVLEAPAAGLLPGLVVGDTRAMDPVLTEDFRRAGLSHLTAVSGANVIAPTWPGALAAPVLRVRPPYYIASERPPSPARQCGGGGRDMLGPSGIGVVLQSPTAVLVRLLAHVTVAVLVMEVPLVEPRDSELDGD